MTAERAEIDAVGRARAAVTAADGDPALSRQCQLELADALYDRFHDRLRPGRVPAGDDLHEALAHLRELASTADEQDPIEIPLLITTAFVLSDLAELEESPAHLTESITTFEALIDKAWLTACLPELGRLLLVRYERDANSADLDRAIDLLRTARAVLEDAPEVGYLLGTALTMQLDQRDLESVDWRFEANEAIEVLSSIPPSREMDDFTASHTSFQLGHLSNLRYLFGRGADDPCDLEEAISSLRQVAAEDTKARYELAGALAQRYHSPAGGPTDRDEAIEHLEWICADETEPNRYSLCAEDLCDLYASRIEDERTGFDEAGAAIEDLLAKTADDDGSMRMALVHVLSRRRPSRLDDLARLADVVGQLLDSGVLPPGEDSGLPELREMALAELALSDGSPDRLDAAREALHETSRTTLPDDWTQLVALEACAVLTANRNGIPFTWPLMAVSADFHAFDHVGLLHHIRRWCTQVPAGTPGHTELLAARALLGSQLNDELTESADPAQVGAEVIGHLKESLAHLPPEDGLRVGLRQQLAVRLSATPGATETDYEAAFAVLAQLDEELPAGHPVRPQIAVLFGAKTLDARNLLGMRLDLQFARERVQAGLAGQDVPRSTQIELLMVLGMLKSQLGGERRSAADLNAAVLDFTKALRLIPAGGRGRADVHVGLALALFARRYVLADLADLDYCRKHIAAARDALAAGDRGWMSIEALAKLDNYVVTAQAATLRPVPAGSAQFEPEGLMGSMALLALAVRSESDPASVSGFLDAAVARAAEEPATGPMASFTRKWHQLLVMVQACAERDHAAFDRAAEAFDEPLQPDDFMPEYLRSHLDGLSWNLRAKFRNDPLARDRAIADLERSLLGTADATGQHIAGEVLVGLYRERRAPGDNERALGISRRLLRSAARSVLLQSSTAARLEAAAQTSEITTQTVLQCLGAGLRAEAVDALESGRALSLYAATAASTVSELLLEENRSDLAEEWRWATFGDSDVERVVPDDLRHRTLDALAGSAAEQRLLSPPGPAAIAQALRDAGADHLVYLIPGDGNEPGWALSVSRDLTLRSRRLPGLTVAEHGKRDGDLSAICDWAWETAIGPLDEELHFTGTFEPSRIVLVPCGALGVVPWHAAQRTVDGFSRPFIADAVVSYAASARQFVEVVQRPRLPLTGRVVYVVDPKEPSFLESEGEHLRSAYYPHAEVYGLESWEFATGRGTGEALLGALPGKDADGAALLHLTCHGESGFVSSRSAFLLDDSKVTVDEVLRHAHGRPRGAAGGLVVAAACQSDLALEDHDEALTLTTALLAAGATTVIGTKWAIPNLPSTVLTIQFHRELAVGGRTPADALRAAQLWALNPHRKPPPDLPPALRKTAVSAELAEPNSWAAFTVHGR